VLADNGTWWSVTIDAPDPIREYIYLGGTLLASLTLTTGTPVLTYYHTDVLGSVRAITDAAGAPVTRHDYFAFGESASPMTGDPRRFLGQELDAETGFDHLGARQYRNVWGRFTSADDSIYMDIFDPQTFNLYAYALNNPLHWIDPSGHAPQDPICCYQEKLTVRPPQEPRECLFGCGVDEIAFFLEGLSLFQQGPRPSVTGIRLQPGPRWTPEEFWGAIRDAGQRAQVGTNAAFVIASPNLALAAGVSVGGEAIAANAVRLLNSNNWVRLGWARGLGGVETYRLAIGSRANLYNIHAHFDFTGKTLSMAFRDFGTQLGAAHWDRFGYAIAFNLSLIIR
jgi:RHS repeat-associated protein